MKRLLATVILASSWSVTTGAYACRDAHRTHEERLIPHLRYNSDALQATGLTNNGSTFRQEVTVHLNPSEIGKAWMNYKGLVEMDLKSNDVELPSLTLREWLESHA